MNSNGVLERIIHSFETYYNVSTENIEAPFAAEAVFKSHSEQYFLVKSAKLSESDSNEFVFFYVDEILRSAQNDGIGIISTASSGMEESLSFQRITELSDTAWERGLSRFTPYYGHRNTDITLVLIAGRFTDDAFKKIKKINHYKSFCFGFKGWARFKIIALELSSLKLSYNRFGADFKKIFTPILNAA